MKMIEVAEGAFFLPAYSVETVIPAYDETTTLQTLSFGGVDEPKEPVSLEAPADAKTPPRPSLLIGR